MRFFSYAPETGMEFHALAEDAQYAAETAIESYCGEDGYPEEMAHICWGEVKQSARMTNKREAPESSEFDYLCDYELFDEEGLSALEPSNPERLPGGATNADTTHPLPSAAPVGRVVGRISSTNTNKE